MLSAARPPGTARRAARACMELQTSVQTASVQHTPASRAALKQALECCLQHTHLRCVGKRGLIGPSQPLLKDTLA